MKAIRFSLFLLFFAGLSTTASAQFLLGGGASYHLDAEQVGANVRAILGISKSIRAQADFTYYLVEEGTFTEINVNGNFVFVGEPGGTLLYALAGLNLTTLGFDLGSIGGNVSVTETGINLGGGVNLGLSDKLSLFGEAKYIVSDFDSAVITAGVLFAL